MNIVNIQIVFELFSPKRHSAPLKKQYLPTVAHVLSGTLETTATHCSTHPAVSFIYNLTIHHFLIHFYSI